MNKLSTFDIQVVAVVLIALLTASSAVAQNNTTFGSGALADPSSDLLDDSAFGYHALSSLYFRF